MEKLLSELSTHGHQAYSVPEIDVPLQNIEQIIPEECLRTTPLKLPEISEVELQRHFTRLSHLNYSLATNFYPLGSCTMKYNPPVNEKITNISGLINIHPYQPEDTLQGLLEILYELERFLCELTGMDRFTLQPAAGAHGELTGLLIVRKYFQYLKEKRNKIIVPDSAHGTNPASAALAGFEIIPLKSSKQGYIEPDTVKNLMKPDVACIMLTVPNTLGLFEKYILEISEIAHNNGSLLYYDGANLNAILGIARPGDFGFDIIHLNLHKTFSAPHGGGGPGSGPVGVKKFLEPFLPIPIIEKSAYRYYFNYNIPQTIGRVRSFYGNIPVLIKAYAYILALGTKELRNVSETAVLNANYLGSLLKDTFEFPNQERCMHEFVVSAKNIFNQHKIKALDIAKRLLDYGYYAPTIYFPLIVEEALMIEPTETETKSTLEDFASTLKKIIKEAIENPNLLKNAPYITPVSRLDEVEAARKPKFHW